MSLRRKSAINVSNTSDYLSNYRESLFAQGLSFDCEIVKVENEAILNEQLILEDICAYLVIKTCVLVPRRFAYAHVGKPPLFLWKHVTDPRI